MKHFINILVILILTGFVIGVTYLQFNSDNPWGFLYLPLIAMMFLWGEKLWKDY